MGVFQEPASIRPLRIFRRTRVRSDTSRATFFTRVHRFSWKLIVGVNLLPRGASVGELDKTTSPSNRRSVEIHETYSRNGCRKKVQIYVKRVKLRILTSFECFTSFRENMKIMVELGPCVWILNLFQDERFSRKSGIRKLRKPGIRKSRKYGIMNRRISGIKDLRNCASRSLIFEGYCNTLKFHHQINVSNMVLRFYFLRINQIIK
jgi:hypothetical protein